MSEKKQSSPEAKLDRKAMIDLARQVEGEESDRPVSAKPEKPVPAPPETDFTTLELSQQMKTQRAIGELLKLDNPYFHVHEGRAGATTRIDGRELINLASYDYLGLNGSKEVGEAAKTAIDQYGTSVSASRPTADNRPVHLELERKLAALYGKEGALTFVSGHATNVSTIGDLMGPKDLILFDALSHNSITVGAKLSGAARRRYPHNDIDALERTLAQNRNRYERVLIVVEGLYSMDGDLPDLARLVDIKQRHRAWLMVDEAHALGVLGPTGRGSFEHCQVDPGDVDIWMGTLSKTLCGCGGYIAGDSALIELLKYHASGFMFSVGMAPPVAAAASTALDLMLSEPERVARLQENGRYALQTARELGLDTGRGEGHSILPILVGDSLRVAKLANNLFNRGIFTIPVTFPAVPMQEARLRFFISSEHTREQMQTALKATAEELQRLEDDKFGLGLIAGKTDGKTL